MKSKSLAPSLLCLFVTALALTLALPMGQLVAQTVSAEAEADALVAAESARIKTALANATTQRASARTQAASGQYAEALATLQAAQAALPANALTQKTIAELKRDQAAVLLDQAQAQLAQGDATGARAALVRATELEPSNTRLAGLNRQVERAESSAALKSNSSSTPGVDAAFLA